MSATSEIGLQVREAPTQARELVQVQHPTGWPVTGLSCFVLFILSLRSPAMIPQFFYH